MSLVEQELPTLPEPLRYRIYLIVLGSYAILVVEGVSI
jgi:hypothetical protein